MHSRIKTIVSDMKIGESVRITCPQCHGEDKTMSVTKESHFVGLYHCFRASCGASGKVSSFLTDYGTNTNFDINIRPERKSARPDVQTRNFTDDELHILRDKYNLYDLSIQQWGWKMLENSPAIYIPCKDNALNLVGYTVRLFPGCTWGMKTKVYNKKLIEGVNMHSVYSAECIPGTWKVVETGTHQPAASFKVNNKSVVLVEDNISALRVWQDAEVSAIALLGTHLSHDLAWKLSQIYDNVLLALDPDTWADSRVYENIVMKGMMFKNFSAVKLSKDPKDLTVWELRNAISWS